MKKVVTVFVLLFVILNFNISASAEEISVSAKAAVVICADSKDVIFEKNIHQKLPMASTTKIMTALILAEQNDLSKTVTVTNEMVMVEGSSMGLKAGDTVTLSDLLYGMLLASGNDAANVAAYAIGGSLKAFAKLMNEKAETIGLKNTNFVTPSGLDNENHYSTAYDMALLTAYALNNPYFKTACSTYTKTLEFGSPKVKHYYKNHNKLLNIYNGMIGVKTGFTKKSGRCLVTAANRNGSTIIAVTLSAPDDWNDHRKMLDFGFDNIQKTLVSAEVPDNINVITGDCDKVKIFAPEKYFTVSKNSKLNIVAKVLLPEFIYSSINAGETVGSVEYYLGDNLICRDNIISVADVLYRNNKPEFSKMIKEKFLYLLRLVI